VESLFLTRYINNQVLAPRLAVLLNEQFPAATTQEEVQTRLASAVDRRIESLQKSLEEQEQPDLEEIAELKSMLAMRDSAVLDEKLLETIGLLDRVAQYLDTPGRKSVYNSTDPFVRERHDKFAINQALKYVHAAIEQATEEFIINPYPENGQHHRVQAFEVLQKAIGLSELEATVDGYNTQPVVVTRLIYHCDTKEVTVDPEINGVGKLYASFGYSPEESFGGFTFYETTADGRPDPRNITGFVQKRPIYDSYDGYFAVQMKQAGLSFDDTTEKLDDGTVAFLAKFEVNPVQVQLVMNTLLLNTLTKEIVQKGMQAQPMNHPLDLTKPSVRVLAGMALPTEQMLVEAAITASMAGRETQAATLAAELARVNSTMNMPMFAPPALGSAAILAVHPGHPQGHPTTEQE
jgi:predicted transcriptional regulator